MLKPRPDWSPLGVKLKIFRQTSPSVSYGSLPGDFRYLSLEKTSGFSRKKFRIGGNVGPVVCTVVFLKTLFERKNERDYLDRTRNAEVGI